MKIRFFVVVFIAVAICGVLFATKNLDYAFTFENALIDIPAVIEEYWEDVGGVKFCYGDSYYRIRLYKTN